MEETGCDQGEAELALELANQDLGRAIRTIESLLRHISALKGKFYFPQKNLYGLLLIVINTKNKEILRLRTVVSYNPALYENSPTMDWYALEKLIYSYRLDEGSLPDFTQDIEQKLQSYFSNHRDTFVEGNIVDLSNLLTEFFKPEEAIINLEVEELNLAQFRKLPDIDSIPSHKVDAPDKDYGTVWLKIELLGDDNGEYISKLNEGELVLSRIIDTRDIAHYLTHLVGSRVNGEMMPSPGIVKKVVDNTEETEVQVYYAPGIMGVARVQDDIKVKIVEKKTQPWWKKLFITNKL